jgi:hypothetical protein
MKRLKRNVLLAVAASFSMLLILSCSDVLEPKVYQDLTPQSFFQTEEDFNSALAALYNPFITDWGTSDPGSGRWTAALYNADPKSYLFRGEMTTDVFYDPWYTDIANFTWGPASFNGDHNYPKIRYVARATDLINKMEESEADIPENVKKGFIAEAKTLRAWLMYILYDFFGPVNVKLDPETLTDTEITPRLPKDEYVNAMITDLTEAIPDLEEKYNGDNSNWGRVSQGTARMVLLRIYMHEKNWAAAEDVGRDLMGMGFSLMDDYEDVFNIEQNNEIIYAIPSSGQSPNYYITEVLPPDFRSSVDGKITDADGGWYGYWIPWDFYDKYASNDERLNTILDEYINADGETVSPAPSTGAIPVKFTGFEGNGPDFTMDQPVFRYAEVLLSVAEAINEQDGPTAEALDLANQVRNRAGLSDWSGLSKAQFRDSLLLERGKEFYGEGLRRADLIRHGKYIEYAQNRTYSSNAQPHMTLFPIPEDVIIEGDGVIEQNPGY